MNKVITLNLNGNAYQLEESGYEALRAYLDTAARRLEGNPDREEIISDIERAIADKFRSVLGAHKTVVITREVEQIIAEMGPVEDVPADDATGAAGANSTQADGKPSAAADRTDNQPGATRRLYKISEGAMLAGVCNGLAAYSNIDVTVIRVLFVILTVFTYGSGGLLYILLMFLLPPAETVAEKAAAYGAPSTAQEFIRRAREGYYEGMKTFHDRQAHREWRKKFKREMRGWKRDFQHEMSANIHRAGESWHGYWGSARPAGSWVAPSLISLGKAALTLVWIYVTLSLVATGAAFGLALPPDIPLWLGLLLLFVAFRLLVWPLNAARHAYYWRAGRWPRHCHGFGDSLVGVAAIVAIVWLANRHSPQVHQALQDLPPAAHHAVDSFRAWWARR